MKSFQYRHFVCKLIDKARSKAVVEVGCWDGGLSRMIWSLGCVDSLILVDPLTVAGCNPTRDGIQYHMRMGNAGTMTQEQLDDVCMKILTDAPGFVSFFRMTSLDAAKYVEDESLDFIFIDGLHFYESVREDILAWSPKIKPGGIISGDDIKGGTWANDVRRAVEELVPEYEREGKVWYAEKV